VVEELTPHGTKGACCAHMPSMKEAELGGRLEEWEAIELCLRCHRAAPAGAPSRPLWQQAQHSRKCELFP
jgi:hypothetical protein